MISLSYGYDDHWPAGVKEQFVGERGVEYAGERIAAFVRDDDDVHTVFFEQGVDIVGYVSLTYLCRFAAE